MSMLVLAAPIAQATAVLNVRDEDVALWTMWLFIATASLALITLTLAFFTFRLWSGAEKTAKRQLRAYLGVAFNFRPHCESGEKFRTAMFVPNCGQTPARETLIKGWLKVMPTKLTMDDVISAMVDGSATEDSEAPVSCYPGDNQRLFPTLRSDEPATADVIAAIQSGIEQRLYAVGTIEYYDVFGEKHHTAFCAYYNHSSVTDNYWLNSGLYGHAS
jgi:hypothetical protein